MGVAAAGDKNRLRAGSDLDSQMLRSDFFLAVRA